mmetsp:Transcript_16790/g.39364  ORF Transcript_16790/g.39364 Transcript_16790/m.39364 type:complete len:328 (-) Transcript_16790:1348-2331(-)
MSRRGPDCSWGHVRGGLRRQRSIRGGLLRQRRARVHKRRHRGRQAESRASGCCRWHVRARPLHGSRRGARGRIGGRARQLQGKGAEGAECTGSRRQGELWWQALGEELNTALLGGGSGPLLRHGWRDGRLQRRGEAICTTTTASGGQHFVSGDLRELQGHLLAVSCGPGVVDSGCRFQVGAFSSSSILSGIVAAGVRAAGIVTSPLGLPGAKHGRDVRPLQHTVLIDKICQDMEDRRVLAVGWIGLGNAKRLLDLLEKLRDVQVAVVRGVLQMVSRDFWSSHVEHLEETKHCLPEVAPRLACLDHPRCSLLIKSTLDIPESKQHLQA